MTDYSKAVYIAIFVFLTVSTFKDLCVKTSPEKQIPMTRGLSASTIGPTIKFLYCYSCGYRKAFDEYSSIIRQRYPEMIIQGDNYEPPGIQKQLAQFLHFIKFVGMACIVMGVDIFLKFGYPSPSWWQWCIENKIYSCLMIFFLANAIEGHLVSTGAFEIWLNDMPVWSKLDTGRIPQPPELFQIIESHLSLDGSSEDFKGTFPKP